MRNPGIARKVLGELAVVGVPVVLVIRRAGRTRMRAASAYSSVASSAPCSVDIVPGSAVDLPAIVAPRDVGMIVRAARAGRGAPAPSRAAASDARGCSRPHVLSTRALYLIATLTNAAAVQIVHVGLGAILRRAAETSAAGPALILARLSNFPRWTRGTGGRAAAPRIAVACGASLRGGGSEHALGTLSLVAAIVNGRPSALGVC